MKTPVGDGWRPTATAAVLRARQDLYRRIRRFFRQRGLVEVETPLLARSTLPDPHIESLATELSTAGERRRLYLQTSPEFAMKRLLAAGSGPIFQIGKAFRDGETGRRHNPEFTLLEWYRPGWDHLELMAEVDELLQRCLGTAAAERLTYRQAFLDHVGLDPHTAELEDLARRCAELGLELDLEERDDYLALLLTHHVEPHLGHPRPTLIHDFPATQAALSRLRTGTPPVAERFELYVDGIELANGFHELGDPAEQRHRFEQDLATRRRRGLPTPPLDENLLAALEEGLPPCAGVALGLDRLLMLELGESDLQSVLTFPIERA